MTGFVRKRLHWDIGFRQKTIKSAKIQYAICSLVQNSENENRQKSKRDKETDLQDLKTVQRILFGNRLKSEISVEEENYHQFATDAGCSQ